MNSPEYYYHPSGLYLPKKKRPIAIDLFAGCGGFSLGIIQAGFEVVAGIDWDIEASITYMVNLGSYPMEIHFVEPSDGERMEKVLQRMYKKKKGNGGNGVEVIPFTTGSGYIKHRPEKPPVKHFWIGDIRKLRGQEMLKTLGLQQGDVDLVVGGPPCQGFSYSGKREVMDPRNSLIFEFARLIIEIQPKTMCMENVPGIVSMVTPEGIPVIDAFCRILEDGGFAGYKAIKKSLLASAGVGVAMKNTKASGKKEMEKDDDEDDCMEQMSLFG